MSNFNNEQIADFYDEYVDKQTITGVNIRHRIIFNNLRKIGLKKNSSVLEIGCGIGTLSGLIINYINNGLFVGVDISKKSVDFANNRFNNKKNASFLCSDMSDFSSNLKFDFIVFPDVLEHIPVEQQFNLFKNISAVCKKTTKILINIPEPECLNWYRKHKPETLQIIDQSLSMQDLLNNTYPHGFKLESLIPYSIHSSEKNYLEIVLYREKEIDVKIMNKLSQLIQNIKVKYF